MSRRDYVKLAESFKCSLAGMETDQQDGAKQLIYDLLRVLVSDNENFQQDTFLRACGLL